VPLLLQVPRPYDFARSVDRFRLYGSDRATVWHDGGLHRVVAGREIRIEAVPGGVSVAPAAPGVDEHVARLLGLRFDLPAFWRWAAGEPVLGALRGVLAGFRPPLQPEPWEALVTAITAQQVSLASACAVRARLVERYGERHDVAWSFPTRERVAAASAGELAALGLSARKAEYVVGLARSELDLDALQRAPDEDVVRALTAVRGLGRWTADWFLARTLGRPDAWPAGDLGLRKAVARFYRDGRMPSEDETRGLGERFGRWRNLTAQMLLAAARSEA
jgi:DNA-3-methyladenine glycosylase II